MSGRRAARATHAPSVLVPIILKASQRVSPGSVYKGGYLSSISLSEARLLKNTLKGLCGERAGRGVYRPGKEQKRGVYVEAVKSWALWKQE